MVATLRELDDFRDFAASRIESGREQTLIDLMMAWAQERELRETIEDIRASMADIEAGRVFPSEQLIAEMRQQHQSP